MRHTSQPNHFSGTTARHGDTIILATLTDPLVATPAPGKHRAAVAVPTIPTQQVRTHDHLAVLETGETRLEHIEVPVAAEPVTAATAVPETARWKASHLPRTLAGVTLGLAVLGTTALAVRFEGTPTSDNFVSLLIAGGVVVALWAMLIASTPQVVTLRGSFLTIHSSSGQERFDLADLGQPLDLASQPRSHKWALLLHRADGSSVVLRRHDVVATELDPVVRHYRSIAQRRYAEREARFNR